MRCGVTAQLQDHDERDSFCCAGNGFGYSANGEPALKKCPALSWQQAGKSCAYVPCSRKPRKMHRFCPQHDQAYREIILGILIEGNAPKGKSL
jgi:hypothetical protein